MVAWPGMPLPEAGLEKSRKPLTYIELQKDKPNYYTAEYTTSNRLDQTVTSRKKTNHHSLSQQLLKPINSKMLD